MLSPQVKKRTYEQKNRRDLFWLIVSLPNPSIGENMMTYKKSTRCEGKKVTLLVAKVGDFLYLLVWEFETKSYTLVLALTI